MCIHQIKTYAMDFNEFEIILKEKFPEVTPEKTERFKALGPLYAEWNSRINVISRKDIDQLYMHHVLHSLAAAAYIKLNFPELYAVISADGPATHPAPDNTANLTAVPIGGNAAARPGGSSSNPVEAQNGGNTAKHIETRNEDNAIGTQYNISFLDLGTGGGFPGIPLAIMFPGASFTLCDSIGKKITVATEISRSLGLQNVTTVNARAESLHGRYTYIVSRAVTSLDRFIPWVKGKYTGGILYLKGGDVAAEIAEASGKHRLRSGSIHTWKIDSWLEDPYFEGKLVIFIEA